ncbi:MAG: patatin-like phospholipase family protein [Pseudobdellovibrionaceae bacterium]
MTKKHTKAAPKKRKKLNLALQGGGAHGAFTWGVLDALLEDDRIDFEGISATSAGSMNAAILAQGMAKGGVKGAKQLLSDFWWEVSEAGAAFSPVHRTPFEYMMALNPFMPQWGLNNSSTYAAYDSVVRAFSPYQFNPLNINPLKDILSKMVDPNVISAGDIKLFISTTDVRRGTSKIFSHKDVTCDVLLASAALPDLFQAVEIGEDAYWDGGYTGNPSLWPLFYQSQCRDILIVHVNPIRREVLPYDAYDIENRENEITFNNSLLHELRSINFVKKLIHEDMLKDEYKDDYKDILIHAIRSDEMLKDLSLASKFDTSWPFLSFLKDEGRKAGQEWLSKNYNALNEEGTVDIARDYLS